MTQETEKFGIAKPPPKPIWRWYFFGEEMECILLATKVHWLARLTTRIFLGSRWERLKENDDG